MCILYVLILRHCYPNFTDEETETQVKELSIDCTESELDSVAPKPALSPENQELPTLVRTLGASIRNLTETTLRRKIS